MPPHLSFVVCTERGHLERESVLFARTLRTFGGALASAPVLSYQPRPGYRISRATRRAFDELGVEHREVTLNTAYPTYGFANKPLAAAHAEEHDESEILVFADSDQLILGEPSALSLEEGFDVGLRPVHIKDVGAGGPEDPTWPYWQELYALLEVEERRYVRTEVDDREILGYWNAGLIAARRSSGLFSRWAESFHRVMARGLRPRGEMVYVEQTVLAATVVAAGLRVETLPRSYNYPMNFHARLPAEKRMALNDMTVLHYHGIFRQPGLRHPLEEVLGDDRVSRTIRTELDATGIFPESPLGRLAHFSRWIGFKLEKEARHGVHRWRQRRRERSRTRGRLRGARQAKELSS